MNYGKILRNLGLSKNEVSIYLGLLKLGKLNISEISKETGISRPAIYSALPYLVESNLINKIIVGKRIYYRAENPENLRSLLGNIKSTFNHTLVELKDIYNYGEQKPIIKSITGKDGIKYIFTDIVNTLGVGDVFYRYSSRKKDFKSGINLDKYEELRNKKKIGRFVITSESRDKVKTKKLDKQVVTIPEKYDMFDDNITKLIYKNKVAIVDYNTLTSFIIESPIFYSFEKKLFKFLFKFLSQHN